ncbi:nuclear transcription factor Y subunit beta isoform X2 [Ctenocephalides felis]|nr:nuclear transcription factor Y subunit beta isoform X2 [Ctenocephalides felis]XP_026478612.1 nuclear transcription factor Y subunit beta isoform X2 [Ctenocephalides felis]
MKIFIFILCILPVILGQRVAPGVPPQQYVPQNQNYQQMPQGGQVPMNQQQQYQQQQMPPQQMQQQQQMHYQQPQVQQQVPVQHQQVPVQPQQVPMQHQQQQHHQGHPQRSQQILNAANIAQEKEHIAEHLELPIDTSKMSEQELQFHYFKMHDADNNNKLDGCELIKSLIHWHEQGSKEAHNTQGGGHAPHAEEKIFSDDELVSLIDPILSMDDASKDGYIDYPEFVRAQSKAAKGN